MKKFWVLFIMATINKPNPHTIPIKVVNEKRLFFITILFFIESYEDSSTK